MSNANDYAGDRTRIGDDPDELTEVYACPECGSKDLEVTVQTWAVLLQGDDGELQTDFDDVQDGSHDWDGDSEMRCQDCGHSGKAKTFIQ